MRSFQILFLCLVTCAGWAQQSTLKTPFGIAFPVNQSITTSQLMTNATLFGYNVIYSNSIPSTGAAGANRDGIALQPYGGNYYGFTITNSFLISSTNEQVGLGFVNAAMPNSTMNFYDIKVLSAGSNGNAVSWNTTIGAGAPTNDVTFYNSQFQAAHYAFNQIGRGTFRFHNCDFSAMGPAYDGASVCFLPDQGPVTNYLYGCRLLAVNGGNTATWCLLEQIDSYNYLYGCTLEATDTNNVGLVAGLACSGEGKYVTSLNSCTIKVKGGTTAYAIDLQGTAGTPSTLYLNDCWWSGPAGPVVVNNPNGDTIIVSGGNFRPENFSSLTGVTFTNYTPVWKKTTYFGSAVTNGAVTLGTYFHSDLFSRNSPWAVQGYTNGVMHGLPSYGYLTNLTVGVGTPFAATTNIVFCIKTNYIGASGPYLGLGDSALKITLRGSVSTPTYTNLSGVGVALTAPAVGVMEIVPSAALQVTTNFWWSFEHWFQDTYQ